MTPVPPTDPTGSKRPEMVAMALMYADLSQKNDPYRWLDLLAPGDERTEYFLNVETYSCALVVRGLFRKLGLDHPILKAPYRVGKAVSDVQQIAIDRGAWVHARTDVLPGRGDVPLVGGSDVLGGPAHVYVVQDARWDGDRAATLESVDGGQVEGGAQKISERERVWSVAGVHWLDKALDNRMRLRTVIGWVDLDALFSA